jgi:hypothetical protein
MREIDDALLDVGLTPLDHKRIAETAAWNSTRKNAIREHMDQAYQIFTKSGLTGYDRVKCLVLTTDKGSQSASRERFGSIPVTAFCGSWIWKSFKEDFVFLLIDSRFGIAFRTHNEYKSQLFHDLSESYMTGMSYALMTVGPSAIPK